MFVECLDEGDIKRRNRQTFLQQAKFFSSWCSRLGVQDVTLQSIPRIHQERILLSYALDVSQGINLKGKDHISVKTVKNYVQAAASHAIDNGLRDPRIRYSPEGLPLNNGEVFPALKKLYTHMKKWADGRDEALPLTSSIIQILHDEAMSSHDHSLEACIFDAVCLGLQTGSRCTEYCKGNPTDKNDEFSKVPLTYYAGEFAGYPIAFVASDITFLSDSMHLVPSSEAISQASFVRVRFRFDKGGTGNVQTRTFRRFPSTRKAFCPLHAACRAINRTLFCYSKADSYAYLQDALVTKHLRHAAETAYPNKSHLYRTRIKDVRTHSLRVTACLILNVAKLPVPTIEYRLRWASTAWKMYVRDSLAHISQACASSFYTALEDTISQSDDTAQQAFDADDLL